MAKKEVEAIEISPDPSEKETKKLKFIEVVDEGDDGSPLRPVLCVKTRNDWKRFEETDDCFILDFDPYEPLDIRRLSISNDRPDNEDRNDDDLTIVYEKGQVACRDYPHPRHLCLKFPFETTSHETHCPLCYCYVCDLAAPCAQWTMTGSRHCDASEHISSWNHLRGSPRDRYLGLIRHCNHCHTIAQDNGSAIRRKTLQVEVFNISSTTGAAGPLSEQRKVLTEEQEYEKKTQVASSSSPSS